MASFNPIKVNGTWYIRCRDPRRREVRLKIPSAKNRNKAERLCEEIETRFNLGLDDPWERKDKQQSYSDMSIKELMDLYLEKNKDKWKDGEEGWNYQNKVSRFAVLKDNMDPRTPVSHIRPQKISQLLKNLDVRQTTKKAYQRSYRALFNWANDEGITDLNTKRIELNREPAEKLTGYIDADDMQNIIDTYLGEMDGRQLYADIWHFTFYNGPRMSEIPEIKKKHVDLNNKYIQIGSEEFLTKHNMENKIPIAPENLDIVKRYHEMASDPDSSLFPLKEQAKQLSVWFTKAAKKTFPGRRRRWGLHLLRHSCGMYLMNEKGWHEEDVQEFLRHTTQETVKKYRHGAPAKLRSKLYDWW